MKRTTLTLTIATVAVLGALVGCQPTVSGSGSSDAASSNPSVGISTHAVVGSSGGSAPTTAAATKAPAPTTAAPDTASAQKLADLDGNTQPVADYQTALTHLTTKCTQKLDKVAAIVYATQDDLQQNGVNDETEYSVIQHLDQSIPAGSGKLDCVSIAAAYVTLRESK